MKWKQAESVILEAEQKLREILASAAADGEYSDVLKIADLATSMISLLAEKRSLGHSGGREGDSGTQSQAKERPGGKAVKRESRSLKTSRTRRGKADYPLFFRRGEDLVKVGWSKKGSQEYSQRAPREVVRSTVDLVAKAGSNGKAFTGEQLLSARGSSSQVEKASGVAGYQYYVALAWLEHIGIVQKRGRKVGYILMQLDGAEEKIDAQWRRLPEWVGRA
jgi:hypothetical protein